MVMFDREGLFRGDVIDATLGQTRQQGYPQVVLKVKATEYFDEEAEDGAAFVPWDYDMGTTGYLCLVGTKDGEMFQTFSCDAVKEVFGWDGADLTALVELLANAGSEGLQCQFRMIEDDWEGRKQDGFKLQAIYDFDAPPTRELRQLDKAEAANLATQFGALFGGASAPKPKSNKPSAKKGLPAGPKRKPTTKPLTPGASSKSKLVRNEEVDEHVASDAEVRAEREQQKMDRREKAAAAKASKRTGPPATGKNKSAGPPSVAKTKVAESDQGTAWEAMVQVREDHGLDAGTAEDAYSKAVFAVVGEITEDGVADITGEQWAEVQTHGVAIMEDLIPE